MCPALEADFDQISDIYAHYVLNTPISFETDPPDADALRDRWQKVSNTGLPYIVAVKDGAIVAYAYATPYRPRPAYGGTVAESVYIAPGAARCGIGTALLTRLIEECARGGQKTDAGCYNRSSGRASFDWFSQINGIQGGRPAS